MLSQRRAQSVLEYALVIAVVAAGLISMQVYLKRGVQGRLRVTSEQIGDNFEPQQVNITRKNDIYSDIVTTEQDPVMDVDLGGTMTFIEIKNDSIKTSEKDAWGTQ